MYGPATADAIQALQKAHGLPVTGTVDKATQAPLQADLEAKGGAAAQESLASGRRLGGEGCLRRRVASTA